MKPPHAKHLSVISLALMLSAGCGGVSARPHGQEQPALRAPSFALGVKYPISPHPGAVAIADLDGNGRRDIVTAGSKTVSVLLNRGHGTFAERVDYRASGPSPEPATGQSLAIADLNLDRAPDIVVAGGRNAVWVLLNRGNGAFRAAREFETGAQPWAIAVGDLDGDGKPDLAVANLNGRLKVKRLSGSVSVLLNRGNGRFASRADYPADSPMSLALADLNGDGKLDVATAGDGETSSVLLNRGNGTFRRGRDYDQTNGASWVVGADLNDDGMSDLAVATNDESGEVEDEGVTLEPAYVYALPNRGDATFARLKPSLETSGYIEAISGLAIGDANGDGKPDLVSPRWLSSYGADVKAVALLLNSGGGRFETVEYPVGGSPIGDFAVAVGDVTGDARPDLVTANLDGHAVSVFVNTPGLCTVQDVAGTLLNGAMPLARAKRALEQAHCRVGAIRTAYSDYLKKDLVVSQKPKFGAVLPGGAKVDLVVSKGRRK